MQKQFYLLLCFFGFLGALWAKPVEPQQAQRFAEQFLATKTSKNLQLKLVDQYDYQTSAQTTTLYYVFSSGQDAYVILSADDAAIPVLGYSTKGSYHKEQQGSSYRKWMGIYQKQLIHIIEQGLEASPEVEEQWQALSRGTVVAPGARSVNPLLTTRWGQSPYYNDDCPYDANAGFSNGYRAVAGCPATAMAQIMKYWAYPNQGTGFHSYNHATYGTLSANFASTTYNWSAMPNDVTSANAAVAELMYHCGVAVEMQYGPTSSGSYVIIDGYPQEQTCEYAYKTYFGYNASTLQGVRRANYSDYAWTQLMKGELDAGRLIQYAGFGAGGHTFVCDGYDNSNYFHMNWGWSGYLDGYFALNALNPGTGGTGSGAGHYNNGQQAVIGIQPPNNGGGGGGGTVATNMQLYTSLSLSSSTIYYGQAFDLTTNFLNGGSSDFGGDFGAAVFNSNNEFVDFVEIKSNWTLPSNSYYTNGVTFSTSGLLSMLPGNYTLSVFYRPTGGDWSQVSGGNYSNDIAISVINPNDIELNSNIVPSTTVFEQGQAASASVNIINTGAADYYGTYYLSLFNLDGSFVETIGAYTESTGLPYNYTYTNPLTFSSSSISAAPGTYLLALRHIPSGGNIQLAGSSSYQNPVFITVKEAALQPDVYENNNTEGTAYPLYANFNGNTASVLTPGSNSHQGSDYDYYTVDLDPGYDYTITARVHDSYDSGNGLTYGNDVMWSYKLGTGAWSSSYDDVMPSTIWVNNGGELTFQVSPYFIGQTGTYLLDIYIVRTPTIDIEKIAAANAFSLYPNPVSEELTLEATLGLQWERAWIVDMSGRRVREIENTNKGEQMTVEVADLNQGLYSLSIQLVNGQIWQDKFIKK